MAMSARMKRGVAKVKKEIMPIGDADPYLNICVFGRTKQGKTRFACTAERVLLLDVNERGTKSAREYDTAKVFHVKKWEDFVFAYWFLRQGEHPFKAVAVDNMTQLQMMCMRHVLREAVDVDPNKDPAMAGMREHGKVSELLRPQILNMRNLPMHTIFLAQERKLFDEEDESSERVPDLSNANRQTLLGSVDVVGRIYQKEASVGKKGKEVKVWEPRMLVGAHASYATGNRLQLPRIIRNPTIPGIIEAGEFPEEEE